MVPKSPPQNCPLKINQNKVDAFQSGWQFLLVSEKSDTNQKEK
tara:strand:- start:131 stop:259 length:129 start_codon:yes stop_codon:yes gene_type:complete